MKYKKTYPASWKEGPYLHGIYLLMHTTRLPS